MIKILFDICKAKLTQVLLKFIHNSLFFIILKTHGRFHMVYATLLKFSLINPAFF